MNAAATLAMSSTKIETDMPLIAAFERSSSARTRGTSRSPRSFSATLADTPCASATVRALTLSEIGGTVDVASP
jgi:hypothetical protein